MADERIGQLLELLQDGADHLRELETRTPRRPYIEQPRPYAWREILAAADYMLDPDDDRPSVDALVGTLADVLAALDEASPPDPNHPSRQTHDRIVDWMTRVATRAGYPTTPAPAPAAEDT
jgi:hypothetical protein